MIILAETEQYFLYKEFEEVHLTHKATNRNYFLVDFYGEATCGIISKDEQYVLVGGKTLFYWGIQAKKSMPLPNNSIKEVYSLREINTFVYHILTDPWKEDAAIWKLDLTLNKVEKLSNFTAYFNEAYTEDIIW
jgi:hypothetical protein